MFAAIVLNWAVSLPGATTFSFVLDEPCKTSAGVFLPDGTLVRTLWSKVRYYAAGTNSAVWDGLDDNGNVMPPGPYQIRLLEHNTEYVWDGSIGNSSAALGGITVHQAFWPMRGMAITGTNAFYVTGYNEGKYDFCRFATTDPTRVLAKWTWVDDPNMHPESAPSDTYDRNWLWAATDGNRVYFACSSGTNPTNGGTGDVYPGFIVACNVSDNSVASFTNGCPIPTGPGPNLTYPNGIYVGTQPGLDGLAVQQNGNLLAASVAADNLVYLFDKVSGAALTNFSVFWPRRLNFSPDGSLWVVSSNSVICFTNVGAGATAASTIAGFSEPLDVAVNPTNANLILVADGGASQQVKAFDLQGTPLWTYGQPGGYFSNGVAVTTNKFWFFDGQTDGTFLCFAPDGSFWVGDGGDNRSLHISAAGNYLEQIMSQPHSYVVSVDANNPSRVFNQFLEFQVDYSKPLAQAWTLVNNWGVGLNANYLPWNCGLFDVTTFTNGRTYALIHTNYFNLNELVELSTNGLRITGLFPSVGLPMAGSMYRWVSIAADASIWATTTWGAGWYQSTLSGFDTNGNPLWNPETLQATAPNGSTDPFPRSGGCGNMNAAISTNNILISFDPSLNNGWHLGGIRLGGTNWLWKASPSGNLNGQGNYEIGNGICYAGNTVEAMDRNVIYGFHGEFFRGQGEASQHMHYYDDGLFVGEFGEASPGHSAYEGAWYGFAGNGHFPNLMKTTNGDYYLWVNDESDHGPERWHLANARNIREQAGSGTLGGVITLTNPTVTFPTGVNGRPGNRSAEIYWLPVPGATTYNVRYSLLNGGPYQTLAGPSTVTNYLATGLTNGQTYYFAVTAILAGGEGIPSEQVSVQPFDTTQAVLGAGQVTEGGQFTPIIDVNSSAPAIGQPGLIGAEHLTGVLNPRELDDYGFGNLVNESLGTRGYALFNWDGAGSNLINVAPNFTVTVGSGWANIQYLQRQFRVDGALGNNTGLTANPCGTINISVTDTNYHYLTVLSPDQFNEWRYFTLSLASSNNNVSASYPLYEYPGLSHTFQFLFKGNVTLTADASVTWGINGVVQGLFLDDVQLARTPLTPPTALHVDPQ